VPKITSIKSQKKPGNVNIFLDGKYAFKIDLANLLKYNLEIGKELSSKEVNKIVEEANFTKISSNLLKFATLRPRSQKEINDWLIRKKTPPSLFKKLLSKLKKLDLLGDSKFTVWWINQRLSFKPKSKRELYFELAQKGIKKEIIDSVLKDINVNEKKIAKALVAKNAYKWQKYNKKIRQQKISQFLLRKGFPWEVVKDVIN